MDRAGNSSFESALFGFFRTLLNPILNQRGEAGDGNPGSDPLEPDPTDANPVEPDPSTDPNPDGLQPSGDQPPAVALKTEPDPALEPDPQLTPADTAFHKSTRFQEMNQSIKDTASEIEQLKSQIEQSNKVAQFYQTQFNESQSLGPDGQPVGQPPTQVPGQQPGQASEPGQLPNGVVAPGKWEDQEQQGAWTEHVAGQRASQMMQEAYQQTLLPMLTQLSNAIASLQQGSAKTGKEDFDDVISDVNKTLFQTGPDGKVYSVLNPALLNYFKTQPNPYEAMYQHGLTLRAPQKIKEGVQKQTQNTLKKIGQQPVGPTQPKGGDAPGDSPELDWDTPESETEKILHKRGLI